MADALDSDFVWIVGKQDDIMKINERFSGV